MGDSRVDLKRVNHLLLICPFRQLMVWIKDTFTDIFKNCYRHLLKPEAPTAEDWIEIVHDIYVLKKLSFTLKGQMVIFFRIWSKWIEYVKPVKSGRI